MASSPCGSQPRLWGPQTSGSKPRKIDFKKEPASLDLGHIYNIEVYHVILEKSRVIIRFASPTIHNY